MTRVIGEARRLLLNARLDETIFVVDRHAVSAVEEIFGPNQDFDIFLVDRPTDIAAVRQLTDQFNSGSATRLVGIGGGNVMDLVKLASLASENPRILDSIENRGGRTGFIAVTGVTASSHIAVIPTTLGTGSEANGAACVQLLDRTFGLAKTLVATSLPLIDEIAYDPDFLTGPNGLVRSGLFEAAVRLLGAVAGHESTIPSADDDAFLLFSQLMEIVDEHAGSEVPPPSLLTAARLSARSHSGAALRGRGQAPSPVWLLANEMSMTTGLSKNEATARLIVPWVDRVRDGDDRWGRREVLNVWLRPQDARLESVSEDPAEDWIARFRLPASHPITRPLDTDVLAARTSRRYGGGRGLLARFSNDDLRAVFDEAVL